MPNCVFDFSFVNKRRRLRWLNFCVALRFSAYWFDFSCNFSLFFSISHLRFLISPSWVKPPKMVKGTSLSLERRSIYALLWPSFFFSVERYYCVFPSQGCDRCFVLSFALFVSRRRKVDSQMTRHWSQPFRRLCCLFKSVQPWVIRG